MEISVPQSLLPQQRTVRWTLERTNYSFHQHQVEAATKEGWGDTFELRNYSLLEKAKAIIREPKKTNLLAGRMNSNTQCANIIRSYSFP